MSSNPATVAIPDYRTGIWKADPVHSDVAFSLRSLMIGKARGRFADHDVTIVTSEDPLGSSVTATIDVASIDTGNAARDKHLRSASYFDVERYPTMTYRSTGVRGSVERPLVEGELTLHGVTRQVPLTLEVNGFGPDPLGGRRVGFSATARLSRREFGIGDTVALDGGGVVMGDKVSISLEIQAVLQK
ncbi:YceI family protein [Streptomyces sp. NBC_00370]|uniref:YceI family protein n=1 Tax=Streptomyces sp. NBC_00370 TaxID=2975728 RepID=UPI002E272682